ncbi:scavenger receptor cysteine-rich domain-containing protein DMBT1-like [Sminthopsis crassicaudata]|uniref:scavenger receptor cysteine-rich domain-containing protein DMBT1-like n=1 Tax=Sminthopsis crassicaudata TaxID=9301 RepID=UPI003D689AFA
MGIFMFVGIWLLMFHLVDAADSSLCGGFLKNTSGILSSPLNVPLSTKKLNCIWAIEVKPNNKINLGFNYFNLLSETTCTDFIEIYDGPLNSRLLAKLCKNTEEIFVSSTNIMTVHFVSEIFMQNTGFSAWYNSFPKDADLRLINSSSYDCSGRVEVLANGQWGTICDSFWNILTAKVICRQLGCGNAISAPRKAFYGPGTGPIILNNVWCKGNEANLWQCQNSGWFSQRCDHHDDAGVTCSGLYPSLNYTRPPAVANYSCGGYFSQPSGKIFSPNYPGNYSNNTNCFWDIQVANNYIVTIVFGDVDLFEQCDLDFIEIYDGPYQTSPRITRICGNKRGSFMSTSNYLSIRFSATVVTPDEDFRLTTIPYLPKMAVVSFFSNKWLVGDQIRFLPLLLPSFKVVFPPSALTCSQEQMTAVFSKEYLKSMGYTSWNFVLYNSSCTTMENITYIIVEIPYDKCGTKKTITTDTINYSNILRVNQTTKRSDIITRTEALHLHISCKMLKNVWVETMFASMGGVDITEVQYSNYHVELAFYETSAFIVPVNSTPYYIKLNQDLFLQAEILHTDSSLTLFVDTCIASPYPDDFTTLTYDLIRDGCAKDETYVTYDSPFPEKARFGFKSFAFLEKHPFVYIQCKMVVCKAFDYSSRCYKHCMERTKRDTSTYEEKMDIVLGPIQLLKEDGNENRNLAVVDVQGPYEYNKLYQPVVAFIGVFVVVVVVFGAFQLKKRSKDTMEGASCL